MSQKKSLALAQVLQRLVLLRLFLPLVALSVIAIGGVGYSGGQTLESQQHQRAQFTARIVDHFLDQAARTLDAVARVAEVSPPEDLATFMQGTWEAYGYFDTLYYLDAGSKITLLSPSDPRYLGLDMSSLSYFQQTGEKQNLIISRPFVSVRTGNPTVYLVRQLDRGGQMVGELSLGSLQDEITYSRDAPDQDVTFIMDQSGMLLAHPSFNLVKQRTNQSYLEIFHRGQDGDTTLVYEYAGTMVLGSAIQVERAGWVVVDQVPLSVSITPYVWALGLTLLTSLVIWLVLTWGLRKQLQQHVAIPLVQFSQGIGALANGDFSRGKALAAIPSAFAELIALAADFQQMSDALQARQIALQESEERFRVVFERSTIGKSLTTPDGKLLKINHAFGDMLGYSIGELQDLNFAALTHPDDFKESQESILCLLTNEQNSYRFQKRYIHKNGTIVWTDVSTTLLKDEKGTPLYFITSISDITERKQAEAEIRKLNQELEQRVINRTAQLEAANKELEAFAYSVSHDLRAPLRHIDGYLELLQKRIDGTLDERSRHYMETISDSARHMGQLIDDLLAFSRMGRQEMSKTQVDLVALVRDIIQELAPEAQGRNIHWNVAVLPTVSGDRAMLRLVLVNLLSNALKFTQPRQEAEIEVGCILDLDAEVEIFVRDNGVGFEMDYADKLFGVFQRLHRQEEFEGTGIGLANVRRIINRHGGRVWAEGKVDQGATFYFSLPLSIQRTE